jgi:epsilon-lactone hydrolase
MTASGFYPVPARNLSIPEYLSPMARMYLNPQPESAPYPEQDDKAAWRAYVDAVDQAVLPLLQMVSAQATAEVELRDAGGARVFDIMPPSAGLADRTVVLEMHGGALILCGGEAVGPAGLVGRLSDAARTSLSSRARRLCGGLPRRVG